MSEQFGDYELVEKIAQGGMAEIFLAKRLGAAGFEKIVAIKRVLPELSWNEEFVSMFINEAKMAALLSHPNITQIFDFGQVDGAYFITMEYVAGKNLRQILNQAKAKSVSVPHDLAALTIARAAAGLEHAHKKSDNSGRPLHIIHRDVSPQNILISFEGDIKVVDFGIAKAVAENPEATRGVLKGKLSYLSPEQVMGKNLDGRSDVFSLGLVLIELLKGEKLFQNPDPGSTLDEIVRVDSAQVAKSIPGINRALRETVRRAIHVDPDERFESAGAFQRALEDYLRASGDAGSTMQLTNFMRLLFDEKVGDQTMVRLRSEIKPQGRGGRFSMPSIPTMPTMPSAPSGSSGTTKRVAAGVVGALAGAAVLVAAAPYIRAAARPDLMVETTPPKISEALSALESGNSAKAVASFDDAFASMPELASKYRPKYVQALVADGTRRFDADDTKNAEARFRKVVSLDPDDFDSHFYLGKILTGRRDPDGAAREYMEAIRINPNSADAQFNLGYIHFSKPERDLRAALEQYRKVAALKPTYLSDVYYNISVCHEYLGDKKAAISSLEEGISNVTVGRKLLEDRLNQLRG